ncbi:MAG: glutathione S-transferase family protein [Pseudomonadota bacterium]
MKIHVFLQSPNGRKPIFVNAYLGLGAEVHVVDHSVGEHKSPAFLAMNPNGKIPVLELDDGSAIWESNVVINRMATDSENTLWPRSNLRYEIMQWQSWEAAHWQPACSTFISKYFFGNKGVDLEAAETAFRPLAKVLDEALEGRDWLVGETLTNADVSVAAYLAYRGACHYPMDGYDNIARWLDAIEALPAWKVANPG